MRGVFQSAINWAKANPSAVKWGGGGLVAAVGVGFLASQVAGGRRAGRQLSEKEKQVQIGAIASSAIAGTMTALGRGSPALRRNVFFGASLGLGIAADVAQGRDPLSAVVTNTVAGAAGVLAYIGGKKAADKGLQALQSAALFNQKAASAVNALTDALNKAKGVHPIFANFLSKETIGIGAAMAAIPIANHIIQRVIQRWSRERQHPADYVTAPGQMDNQAGERGGRGQTVAVRAPRDRSASVTINGQVRTYYDTKQAMKGL